VGQDAAQLVRQELQLQQGWVSALARWLGELAQFNLGRSMVSGEPVWHELSHHLAATLSLALAAAGVALAVGAPAGAWAAMRPGGWADRGVMAAAAVLRAVPSFLLALLLMLGVAVGTGLLPAAGHGSAKNIVLPALALGLGLGAGLAQVLRDALVRVQASPAVQFARTKGLPSAHVWRQHVLRPSAGGVLAYLASQWVVLLEGAVVVESLFAWPGVGHALVHAIFGRDLPMVQGCALVLAMGFVAVSAALDAAVRRIDPRLEQRP
jgi:peptide/nickel transport system permease protein